MREDERRPARDAAATITTGNDTPSGGGLDERLLTARQLGDLLGFAAGTIVDWAESGALPHFKLGNKLRFRPSEVEAFLEQHRGVA